MKRILFLLPLLLVLLLLVPTAMAAEAACEGCTLGTWEGLPACIQNRQLHICANNFPDNNFRAYIAESVDTDHNMLLTNEECNVATMNVNRKGIYNLEGIGYFTAIFSLYSDSNYLTELDLSNNINLSSVALYGNQLTSIRGYLPNLTSADCSNNNFTEFDLSLWPNLRHFNCRNNRLSSLDLSSSTYLYQLECDNNFLKSLDIRKNRHLVSASCQNQYIYVDAYDADSVLQCDLLALLGPEVKSLLDYYSEKGMLELDPETYVLTAYDTQTLTVVLPLAHNMRQDSMNPTAYGVPYISYYISFNHNHQYQCHDQQALATCTLCGQPAPNDNYGHDFGDEQVCMATPTCTICGYQQANKIVHHNWKDRGICLPRICTRCCIEDPDNPPLHRWYGTATCTKSRSCIECGAEEGILGPHRNRPETEIVLEPTWRETGLKVLRCARCDEIIEEITIPALWDTPEGRLRPMVTLARILDFSTFLAVIVVLAVVIIKDLLPKRKRKK